MSLIKRTLQTTIVDLIPATLTDEQECLVPTIQKCITVLTMVARDLEDLMMVDRELYYRGAGGVMA